MIYQLGFLEPTFNAISNTFFKLITAIIIFLFGFIIGKILGRLVYKGLKEIEINVFIKNTTSLKMNADSIVSNIISYAIYFISLVAALEQIGLANVILYFLVAAVIVVILISFFLAIRDFLPNLISGIYLYRKEIFREGVTIEVNEVKGKLLDIDLLQIKIETKKGDVLYLPNSLVAKSKIKVSGKRLKH